MVPRVQTTHLGKFALEDVNLIEEEVDGCAEEPPRVDNALKEHERFGHPILWYETSRQRKVTQSVKRGGVNSLFSTPPEAPDRIRSARYRNDGSDALETVNTLFFCSDPWPPASNMCILRRGTDKKDQSQQATS